MAPRVDNVLSDTQAPLETDVVVIGGGIIGVSTALALAQKGIAVVLCEKGHIAGEQSSRNWGWCRAMGRDPRELHLALESLKIWRTLNDTAEVDTGFRQIGALFICETEEKLAQREAWLPHAREHQLDTRLLGREELARLLPQVAYPWVGALHTPSDGVAEPTKAAPAIAAAARRHGAVILTNHAVRGLDTAAGRVCAVVTEKGRIACRSVVLAGGAWSRLFCGNLGIGLPQLKVLENVLRTAPVEGGPGPALWGSGLAVRKRLDGGYTVSAVRTHVDIVPDSFRLFSNFLPALRLNWRSLHFRFGNTFLTELGGPRRWRLDRPSPFEQVRVLDPEPIASDIATAEVRLQQTFPLFKDVPTVESWAGLIDVTPDMLPIISAVDAIPGFFIATGFSGHGFGIGPAAGRLMADLVIGDTPLVDPAAFRLTRLTDAPRSKPMPGL